ncbi:MAG: hypothetical protein QNK11_02250, partial [Legionella sp.]|nr:hypothetical protein [Legionella sp.]
MIELKKYPNLVKLYEKGNIEEGKENIEVILDTLKNHFSDLFDLDVLEAIVKQQNETPNATEGSYVQLYKTCLKELDGLYTENEIIQALHQFFNRPPTSLKKNAEDWLLRFTLAPKQVSGDIQAGQPADKQIGYFEKLATNTTNADRVAEPLSYWDMLRMVRGINFHLTHHGANLSDAVEIPVLQKRKEAYFDDKARQELCQKKAFFIDFSTDAKDKPQWGALNLTDPCNPRFFCEMPLADSDKSWLEETFNLTQCTYEGKTSSAVQTTGYTAALWLGLEELGTGYKKQAYASAKLEGDFSSVSLNAVAGLMHGSDVPGLDYTISPTDETYSTQAFNTFKSIKRSAAEDYMHISPSFGMSLYALYEGSTAGSYEGKDLKVGDVQGLINAIKPTATYRHWHDDRKRGGRTDVPALSDTLAYDQEGYSAYSHSEIEDNKKLVRLDIKDTLNVDNLRRHHIAASAHVGINSSWLSTYIGESVHYDKKQVAATLMLFAFVRGNAKVPVLDISLDDYFNIKEEDKIIIIKFLKDNAFITEFKLRKDHPDLLEIQKALEPTLARNRWLNESGYLPPISANYWKIAANYWLIHLSEVPELLDAVDNESVFKRCILEMGLEGLRNVIEILEDEGEQERLQKTYGKKKIPFYLGCDKDDDFVQCLDLFLRYVEDRAGAAFPFSQVGIVYAPNVYGNDKLIEVLAALNKEAVLEDIILTDCLQHPDALDKLLALLIEQAQSNQWEGLIVIPELGSDKTLKEDGLALRNKYTLLNDIILSNKRKNKSKDERFEIEKTFSVIDNSTAAEEEEPEEEEAEEKEKLTSARFLAQLDQLERENGNQTWPYQRGGAVQLQLQQQQQMQQERQVQQEKQHVMHHIEEQVFVSELVTHENIDALLGDFWEKYKQEHPEKIRPQAAALNTGTESDLQGFFHTWVNAKTGVKAKHVIQSMTLDAAKTLLKKHTHLTSGVCLTNLPKCFFTQPDKNNALVLCHDVSLSYSIPPTPLTLELDTAPSPLSHWEGDFRQFALDKYIGVTEQPKLEDSWDDVLLYAYLQPPISAEASESAFQNFLGRKISLVEKRKYTEHADKIKKSWYVFEASCAYAGENSGLEVFLNKVSISEDSLTAVDAIHYLCQNQAQDLTRFAKDLFGDNEQEARALGQIYYKFGADGVTTFLRMLESIEKTLGREFLAEFKEHYLSHTDNFTDLMSVKSANAVVNMIETLKKTDSVTQANKKVFMVVMQQHMQSVGWDRFERLWAAFDYTVKKLNDSGGLTFDLEVLARVKPENMLVFMDRVLTTVENLPEAGQKDFLKQLGTLDLTHGGVHYAVQ